jgi:cell surface protein SprA
MKNFDQSITINYTLPLDKFPATDWLGADYRYNVSYNWKAGPVNFNDALNRPDDLPDKFDFKNTIQNNREQNFTGKVDFVKLYNKVKILKELNTPKKQLPAKNPSQRTPQRPPVKADTVKTAGESMPGIAKGFFRLLMSLRSVNATYTLSEGTILPGFKPKPSLFGLDGDWSAPGLSFILGSQNPDIRIKAGEKDWLVKNENLTLPFTQVRNENINIRANIEPSSDFKIQLDFKKEKSANYQETYRWTKDEITGDFDYSSINPSRSGSYRISILSIGTTFNPTNDKVESEVFQKFEKNLAIVQRRFQEDVLNIPGTSEYDSATQDVLIPAFIAAYSGKSAKSISLSPFPSMPAPNWRIDYTGLNKIDFFNNIFQSITLSNAYQSTYSVVNYSNSLEADIGADKLELDRAVEGYNRDFFASVKYNPDGSVDEILPVYVISQVMISEQFSPLIGVNVRTKGRLTANFQYKTKRDLALNISNAQITELTSKDVSFELGYTKNNMRLPIKSRGRTMVLKNDVTFRLNTTVSDNKTIQRKINEANIVTNGNINIQLRPNISYVVNQKLNIQVYFERTINEPLVSNSYRRATTRFGTQIRFSLAQ